MVTPPDAVASHAGLSLRNLTKVFGQTRALTAVDLDIESGRVLGLLGHNGSGKSTLFKILAGVYEPDAGQLSLDGVDVPLPLTSVEAARIGLTFVHQDIVMLPELSVAENLLVETISASAGRPLFWRRIRSQARAVLKEYGLDVDVTQLVGRLGAGERAQLAIIRAAWQARLRSQQGGAFLMLDEPTVFLAQPERESLFALIRSVARAGVGVVLVSHDLSDIQAVTDQVCVLRDGRVAAVRRTAETNEQELVDDIIGRQGGRARASHQAVQGDGPAPEEHPVVRVRDLSGGGIRGVDLDLHRGEVVGLTGLVGSGFSRILDLVYGSRKAAGGEMELGGRVHAMRSVSPVRSLREGMVLIPGDRRGEGLFSNLSASENLAVPIIERLGRFGQVRARAIAANFDRVAPNYAVRPLLPAQPAGEFSGGNQQKILMAKWLQMDPTVVLVDEPTQGVDVGARQEILLRLRDLATRHRSCVVVASSDYEQLAEICDRVIVVSHGRVAGELVGDDVTAEVISTACLQGFPSQGELGASRLAAT